MLTNSFRVSLKITPGKTYFIHRFFILLQESVSKHKSLYAHAFMCSLIKDVMKGFRHNNHGGVSNN